MLILCDQLLNVALWLAGVGHFCVLGASFQVPRRLGWAEDLPKLRPFNRKLMHVYSGYTVYTIIAFGILTFYLHGEMLRGERAATALAVFIAIYWSARIAVDFLYYEHKDWPPGRQFVVGHTLLTGLFAALAITYWAVPIPAGMALSKDHERPLPTVPPPAAIFKRVVEPSPGALRK